MKQGRCRTIVANLFQIIIRAHIKIKRKKDSKGKK